MDIPQLKAYFEQHPRSPLFARVALELLYEGQTNDAIGLCHIGLVNYPEYATGHLVLAKCYAHETSFALAINSLQEAKKYFPDLPVYERLISEWTSYLSSPPQTVDSDADIIAAAEPVEPLLKEEEISEPDIQPVITDGENVGEPVTDIMEIPPPIVQEGGIETGETGELKPSEEVEPLAPEIQESKPEETVLPVSVTPIPEPPGMEQSIAEPPTLESMEPTVGAMEPPAPEPEVHDTGIPEPEVIETVDRAETSPLSDTPSPQRDEAVESQGLSSEELKQIQRPPANDSDEWRIVSRTLAEIFATQGEYDEAIITYRLLIRERPDLSGTFQSRIDELIKLREAKILSESEQKSPGAPGLS